MDRLAASFDAYEIVAQAALFKRGDALYIVESGRVTVSLPLADGRSVRLRSFGPSTIVGEMAVYTQAPRSADVVADEPARLQRLTLASLRALETDDPLMAQEWHRFIVKMMASRLAVADEALAPLCALTLVDHRSFDAAFPDRVVDIEVIDRYDHAFATADALHLRMREASC